jgi:hypothetical protein
MPRAACRFRPPGRRRSPSPPAPRRSAGHRDDDLSDRRRQPSPSPPPPPTALSGERPDGKPFGSWTFPLALPECPDNGLVLYKDYTPEEVAKLEPLVASEAYQALRKEDTPYYRAYWLMKEMGVGPERYLWALLQASWEAEAKPELRKRYLTELAEASAAVPRGRPTSTGSEWKGGRSTRFASSGASTRRWRGLPRCRSPALDVPMPPAPPAGGDRGRPDTARLARSSSPRSSRSIERRDSAIEPLDLLPRSVAIGRCLEEAGKLDEAGKAFCDEGIGGGRGAARGPRQARQGDARRSASPARQSGR